MKLAMLSRQPRSYTAKRLKEAARQRGHTLRVLDTMRFSIYLERGKPSFLGTPEQCREQLSDIRERYDSRELVIQSFTNDFSARLESYALLAEIMGLDVVASPAFSEKRS